MKERRLVGKKNCKYSGVMDMNSLKKVIKDWCLRNDCKIEGSRSEERVHENEKQIYFESTVVRESADWLDVMLQARVDKIGFSLEINDLPDTEIGKAAKDHESKYWIQEHPSGWESHIDTTFALYSKGMRFTYDAVRLDRPYTIKHEPWYITKENITPEWRYYLDNITPVSTWGIRIKNGI